MADLASRYRPLFPLEDMPAADAKLWTDVHRTFAYNDETKRINEWERLHGNDVTIRNPMHVRQEQVNNAAKQLDYLSSFLPPDRARAEVLRMTGVDLGEGVQTPNQRKILADDANLTAQRLSNEASAFNTNKARAEYARLNQVDSPDAVSEAHFQMGVPQGAPALPKGISRAAADRMTAQYAKESEKKIADVSEQVGLANRAAQAAQEFATINARQGTGGVSAALGLGRAHGMVNSDVARLNSITSELVPLIGRGGLPGSASNLDVEMFKQAVPSYDKPREANQNIVAALTMRAGQEKERLQFLEAYRSAPGNRGSLQGAEAAWQEYLDANPIFKQGTTTFEVNTKRPGWREYFQVQQELKRRGLK